jgi:hypothetical protein
VDRGDPDPALESSQPGSNPDLDGRGGDWRGQRHQGKHLEHPGL